MRLGNDGGAELLAEDAGVGEGEGAAGDLVGGKLLGAGAIGQVDDTAGDAEKALLLGLLEHGDDQTPLQRDGDADVDVLVVADGLAFRGSVHDRVFAKSLDGGAGDERHVRELDAVALLVLVLFPFAEFDDAGHVHLENGVDMGAGGLGFDDDTAMIQRAIDEVSALPLTNGLRGAVILKPGTYLCSETLNINASGVVLRGSGALEGGTTLRMTGEPHVAIAIAGKQNIQVLGAPAHIKQAYVPSGAQSITLDDASSFTPGDSIRITRYTTSKWLHFMGMDGMVRDGKPETWVGDSISTIRVITAIQGNICHA